MATRQPRGAYAKGTAKREEIIKHAIDAFGRTGYHATSMREIAAACNLSQAGLLHHFASKEALLLAIVAYRETENDDSLEDFAAGNGQQLAQRFIDQALHNHELDALTRLWANLAGEATDPGHPAHGYFKERYRSTRTNFAKLFAKAAGREAASEEDFNKAAVLIAAWDGLQAQWLIDEGFDMMPAFKAALALLLPN